MRDIRFRSKQTLGVSTTRSALCQKRTSCNATSKLTRLFLPTREAITREDAATRIVSVAAAARLPAAFAP